MAIDDGGLPVSGWYADPRVPHQLRWWDGEGWTTNVYMPERAKEPDFADLIPGLAPQTDGKWAWPE